MTLYPGSYVILSSQGEYVPQAWGIGWVKWYKWAPRGFVSGRTGTEQKHLIQTFCSPLWFIDRMVVHRSEFAGDGKHRINDLLNTELEKRLDKMNAERGGAANRGQPFSLDTNTTSSTAGSR